LSQVRVDDDYIEFPDRIGGDEVDDRLDRSRYPIDGNVVQRDIRSNLGLKPPEPGGISFDGQHRACLGGPPKGGLAAAEFEDITIPEIALCQKIDRGIGLPRQRGAVGGTGRHGEAAFPVAGRETEADRRDDPVRERAQGGARSRLGESAEAWPRCVVGLPLT
jgi:hypothetical protein